MTKNEVWYHHSILFSRVSYGIVTPSRSMSEDEWFLGAYDWLATKVGFYPLFLAAGAPNDVMMTGYSGNWRKLVGGSFNKDKVWKPKYIGKGEAPNIVLFSFRHVSGVFTDYEYWHLALGAYGNRPQEPLKPHEERLIFKRSWTRSRWLKMALKEEASVQLIAMDLDLRKACRVWCRNKATKKALEKMGFSNVSVKRIPVKA